MQKIATRAAPRRPGVEWPGVEWTGRRGAARVAIFCIFFIKILILRVNINAKLKYPPGEA